MRYLHLAVCIALINFAAIPLAGRAAYSPATKPAAQAALPDRAIDPWDLLRVSIEGLQDPNSPTVLIKRVDQGGNLWLLLIGAIDVRGKQPGDVVTNIVQVYRDRELIEQAKCTVEIIESAADANVKPGVADKGDVLEVRIWGIQAPNKEWQENCAVDADGKIIIPRIGKLEAAGLSDGQIETAINKALHDGGLINHAMVSVRRVEAK